MIRLGRVGKTKKPTYRLIISEKTKDTFGDYLEKLGYYDPGTNPATLKVDEERIKYWISKGAKLSPTVNNLLVERKIIAGSKVRVVQPKKKAVEEKKEEAKPAAAKPAEAPKA